jgi:hypothetical protein
MDKYGMGMERRGLVSFRSGSTGGFVNMEMSLSVL